MNQYQTSEQQITRGLAGGINPSALNTKPNGEIEDAFQLLEGSIAKISKATNALEDRLVAVLRQGEPCQTACEKRAQSSTPMAERVHSYVDRSNVIIDQLTSLLQRIQL